MSKFRKLFKVTLSLPEKIFYRLFLDSEGKFFDTELAKEFYKEAGNGFLDIVWRDDSPELKILRTVYLMGLLPPILYATYNSHPLSVTLLVGSCIVSLFITFFACLSIELLVTMVIRIEKLDPNFRYKIHDQFLANSVKTLSKRLQSALILTVCGLIGITALIMTERLLNFIRIN